MATEHAMLQVVTTSEPNRLPADCNSIGIHIAIVQGVTVAPGKQLVTDCETFLTCHPSPATQGRPLSYNAGVDGNYSRRLGRRTSPLLASNSPVKEFVTMNKTNTEVRAREIANKVPVTSQVINADQMTDEELLAEYRLAGSPQIFETLVRRYERELYNYLRRFLGNTVLAEDAFQATFMQVHLKCHLFDGERKVRPWLYTVATNQAIDIQRRNRRHRLVSLDRVSRSEHEELGTLINLLKSREDDPGDQMETGERKDWVRDAVAALPEQLRTAVGLVYFKGMKYREAADELDVPVGTVKSRIHSAVKRLGEAWEQNQGLPANPAE
jgi:RNA polymerase sigma-70 factor (ECF subfamily)